VYAERRLRPRASHAAARRAGFALSFSRNSQSFERE
jgi:hypothetical protein